VANSGADAMRRAIYLVFLSAAAAAAWGSSAVNGQITFETTPTGQTPLDNAALADPYTYSGGSVRFFFDTNGNNRYDPGVDALPEFELAGDSDPINGF